MASPGPVPVTSIAPRHGPAALQRCGGRSCPPGTCSHDDQRTLNLARKPFFQQAPAAGPDIVHDVIGSVGQALPDGMRTLFERRIGHDFRDVRIHTDARAARSAESVGASAYTVGRHVVFGDGAYQPATTAGRRTLAHELVHVVQQGLDPGRPTEPPRMASTIVPADDPTEHEAERFANTLSAPAPSFEPAHPEHGRAIAREGHGPVLHRQLTGQTGTTQGTQPAPPTAAQQCTNLLTATTAEAVRQIEVAEVRLITFEAEQVYPLSARDPAMVEHRRVAAHLLGTFNTTDALEVQAISYRLARIRRALANGEIQMSCGTGCGAAVGGNVRGGHSPGPFQFTLCSTGATPVDLAPTLIHESAHAVLPDVGVTARPTATRSGVIDRAYDQERLFSHLSPTEALTNAESYSGLVTGLVSGTGPAAVAGASDTVTGCSSRATIETSLGRAQVAARLLASWLDGAIEMLRSSGSTVVSTISDPFVTDLQSAFPNVQTLADLRQLGNDASVVFNNFINPQGIRCTPAGVRCPPGRLGFVNNFAVTASAQTRLSGILDVSGLANVCPDWTGANDQDQATTMYALVAASYLGGAAIQLLTPADAIKLARFAQLVVGRYLPPPTARTPTEHLFH